MKLSDDIYKYIEFLDYDINYNRYGYIIYENADIFSIEHPYGEDAQCGSGKIIKINNYEFTHTIPTDVGSSRSPILLLNNNINLVKVIGIHKYADYSKNLNFGTFIGELINFYNQHLLRSNNISNLINQEMNQLSLNNSLINNQNLNYQINNSINISNANRNFDFSTIYQKLINSLNNLRHNKLDLPNVETIKMILEKKC